MIVVLNELSVPKTVNETMSQQEARMIIDKFIELLHLLMSKHIKRIIATSDIYSFNVIPSYGIQNWLNDNSVPKEHRDFMRSVCGNRCEYIEAENYSLSEFVISVGKSRLCGIGCLVAFEIEEKVISLGTQMIWNSATIDGTYSTLDVSTEEVVSSDVELKNISNLDHLTNLVNEEIEELSSSISSGYDVWEQRKKLFPNLEFCSSVKAQLIEDSQGFHIKQVLKKLKRMDIYFGNHNRQYSPQELGLDARTESDTVQQDPQLKRLRLFQLPDGTSQHFFDHVGFTGNYCGRIHFYPDTENQKCYIGYIGKHLKTKKF
ncbi:MAG: hypothetical protein RSE08_07745 [Lactococcus sp.]